MKWLLGLLLVVFFIYETYNLIVSIKNAREQKKIRQQNVAKEQDKKEDKISKEKVGNSKDK